MFSRAWNASPSAQKHDFPTRCGTSSSCSWMATLFVNAGTWTDSASTCRKRLQWRASNTGARATPTSTKRRKARVSARARPARPWHANSRGGGRQPQRVVGWESSCMAEAAPKRGQSHVTVRRVAAAGRCPPVRTFPFTGKLWQITSHAQICVLLLQCQRRCDIALKFQDN